MWQRGTLADLFGDMLVYRNLEPMDPRLDGLSTSWSAVGLDHYYVPRKTSVAYAAAVMCFLRRAQEARNVRRPLERVLFVGDTLMEYAMLGLLLVAFRNVHSRTLLVLAFVLLAVFPVGNLVLTEGPDDLVEQWEDSLPLAELRVDHPYLGSPMDVFMENGSAIPPRIWSNLHGPEASLAIFSMFLVGLLVGRTRILNDVDSQGVWLGYRHWGSQRTR